MFEDYGEYLLRRIRQGFDREQSPDGSSWTPLSPATVEQKRREGRDNGILKYTRALRDTITYQAKPRSLEIGSNRPYAAAMQFGKKRSRRGAEIPARPFLGITAEDKRELVTILQEELSGSSR